MTSDGIRVTTTYVLTKAFSSILRANSVPISTDLELMVNEFFLLAEQGTMDAITSSQWAKYFACLDGETRKQLREAVTEVVSVMRKRD
jgi:hypothetical protein